ncbi:MAG: hypothetical protein PHT88_00435 [Candidatus Moranbacteria bacterium]|nr:hypothetical protein [Candidatus Moranbacteria bacterium]
MITMLVMTCKTNAQLSSVAFFDPLTKWGNKRFLDEVFLPQLLLEACIEADGDGKDEAIHFIQVKLNRIESLKKVEQDILVRLLAANIKKYLLHPADQCFRIDKGVFRIIITRKKVRKEESDQFLQTIQTAADDTILIYPALESVVSTTMLSWVELAEHTLHETIDISFDVAQEEENEAEQEVVSTWAWISNALHKKSEKTRSQSSYV